MTGRSARLSAAEVHAIRRAAQRQLTRWAKLGRDADADRLSTELRQALQTLRMFREGCELHPIGDREQGRGCDGDGA
jgi:hypothetical protein